MGGATLLAGNVRGVRIGLHTQGCRLDRVKDMAAGHILSKRPEVTKYEVTPLKGVAPVLLGMSRGQVRLVMGTPIASYRNPRMMDLAALLQPLDYPPP